MSAYLVYDCEEHRIWTVLAEDADAAKETVVDQMDMDGDSLSAVVLPKATEEITEILGLIDLDV